MDLLDPQLKIIIEMTASVAAAKQTKRRLAGNIVAALPWSAALLEASLRALGIFSFTPTFKVEMRRMPGISIYSDDYRSLKEENARKEKISILLLDMFLYLT